MSNVFIPLWHSIVQVVDNILNFFQGIGDAVSKIVNTGQGLFAGLVSVGSFIWKAINDFGKYLYDGFTAFAKWLYDGVVWFSNRVWDAIVNAFYFLASAIQWLSNQIYALGNWIYNAIYWVWSNVVNIIVNIVNWVMERIKDVWETIGAWYGSIVDYFNQWLTNVMLNFRRKFETMVLTNITIYGTWKTIEELTKSHNVYDIPKSFLKIISMPFIGLIASKIINAIVPMPSTQNIEIIPKLPWGEFKYTPISIVLPVEKPAPVTPTVPVLPTVFKPVNEVEGNIDGEVEYIFPVYMGYEAEGVVDAIVEYEWVGSFERIVEGNVDSEVEKTISFEVEVEGEIVGEVEAIAVSSSENTVSTSAEYTALNVSSNVNGLDNEYVALNISSSIVSVETTLT